MGVRPIVTNVLHSTHWMCFSSCMCVLLGSTDMLVEISHRLAVEAGYPDDVDVRIIYPDLEIRESILTAVERLRPSCFFIALDS
jgi:hypothetical protein